ncbi:MAG: hypothetical protein ABI771_16650, partial [Betaproteobacteria bacterium]
FAASCNDISGEVVSTGRVMISLICIQVSSEVGKVGRTPPTLEKIQQCPCRMKSAGNQPSAHTIRRRYA